MDRDASLVSLPDLCRPSPVLFCCFTYLLPFAAWFPRHQVVAHYWQQLQLVVVVIHVQRLVVETDQKCDSRQTQISLLSLFSRFPIFDSRPSSSFSHAPSLISLAPAAIAPTAKLRPHRPLQASNLSPQAACMVVDPLSCCDPAVIPLWRCGYS